MCLESMSCMLEIAAQIFWSCVSWPVLDRPKANGADWVLLCQVAWAFGIWHQCRYPFLHTHTHVTKWPCFLHVWFGRFFQQNIQLQWEAVVFHTVGPQGLSSQVLHLSQVLHATGSNCISFINRPGKKIWQNCKQTLYHHPSCESFQQLPSYLTSYIYWGISEYPTLAHQILRQATNTGLLFQSGVASGWPRTWVMASKSSLSWTIRNPKLSPTWNISSNLDLRWSEGKACRMPVQDFQAQATAKHAAPQHEPTKHKQLCRYRPSSSSVLPLL